jgi:hypothetical protein
MPLVDTETMLTMINAKLRNMKPEELEKLLDKLNKPEPEEEEGEQKEGQKKPEGPPKPGQQPHQQGQPVHEYGKEKKS